MGNKELAAEIAEQLFTTSGAEPTKVKQLRMYTDFGDEGKYLAGWGEVGATGRIEKVLNQTDATFRHTVADALAALLEKVSATRQMGSGLHTYDMTMPEVIKEVRATIAKLGLEVKQ